MYIIYGFIFGCLIPFLARKIGKLCTYTPGFILLKIFVPTHIMPWQKLKNNPEYIRLFQRYLMRSLGWGIFTAAATYFFHVCFDSFYTAWYISFLWILLLCVETDKRFMILPDILTLPLLILGFGYAAIGGNWLNTADPEIISNVQNSFLGAAFGFLIPIIASLFIVWKHPEAFGGGDIKILAAIGAWLGFEAISYVILLSCLIFAATCLINKQKVGPFGPSIVYASLLVCILLFGF